MPAPLWLGHVNKYGINLVAKVVAPWAPGFAVVIHRGRTSGRTYRTPVLLFRRKDGFLIYLTYGSNTDWVRNVRAAGGCEVLTRGRHYLVDNPQISRDQTAAGVPPAIGFVLRRVVKADEFLTLEVAQHPAPGSARRTTT